MGPLLYRCIFKILTAQASALQRYSSIVSEQLLQVFADLGVPSIVQCDRGTEFLGCVKQLASLLEVKIIHSSPRHPQSQGKVFYEVHI